MKDFKCERRKEILIYVESLRDAYCDYYNHAVDSLGYQIEIPREIALLTMLVQEIEEIANVSS